MGGDGSIKNVVFIHKLRYSQIYIVIFETTLDCPTHKGIKYEKPITCPSPYRCSDTSGPFNFVIIHFFSFIRLILNTPFGFLLPHHGDRACKRVNRHFSVNFSFSTLSSYFDIVIINRQNTKGNKKKFIGGQRFFGFSFAKLCKWYVEDSIGPMVLMPRQAKVVKSCLKHLL